MTQQGRLVAQQRLRARLWTVVAVFLFMVCAVAAVVAVGSHNQMVQSSYVQNHGVRDDATVVSVHNSAARSDDGTTTYTARVTVHLRQPVNGTVDSLVWVPNMDNSHPGDVIAVLVDSRQPGYCELPGQSYAGPGQSWGWILSVGFSLFFLVLGVLATREAVVRRLRQRRFAGAAYFGDSPDRF
jgi:hypothetical protein